MPGGQHQHQPGEGSLQHPGGPTHPCSRRMTGQRCGPPRARAPPSCPTGCCIQQQQSAWVWGAAWEVYRTCSGDRGPVQWLMQGLASTHANRPARASASSPVPHPQRLALYARAGVAPKLGVGGWDGAKPAAHAAPQRNPAQRSAGTKGHMAIVQTACVQWTVGGQRLVDQVQQSVRKAARQATKPGCSDLRLIPEMQRLAAAP